MKYNILAVAYDEYNIVRCTNLKELKFDSYSEAKAKVKAYKTLDIMMDYPNRTEYHIVCVKEEDKR